MAEVEDLCTACNGTGLKSNTELCPVCGGTPSASLRAELTKAVPAEEKEEEAPEPEKEAEPTEEPTVTEDESAVK